jgi:hypothetical protein
MITTVTGSLFLSRPRSWVMGSAYSYASASIGSFRAAIHAG